MIIVFDLDGTLIDSSKRLYCLFQRLIPESEFSKFEYWELKRNKIDHQSILEKFFPEREFDIFNKEMLSKIELPEYLSMDRVFPDTIETLECLSVSHTLVWLTARQSKERLMREMEWLHMDPYFDSILVTESKTTR